MTYRTRKYVVDDPFENVCEELLSQLNVDHGQDYLVGGMKRDIQNLIVEGTKLPWESYKLEPYVQRCIEAFTKYNENVTHTIAVN